MEMVAKVSVHGGHSGQFCNHATDSLEEVVKAYIDQGFSWVGITEHAPGVSEELLYTDQRQAGLTPALLYQRFGTYVTECRRLQALYADRIRLYTAMEIETYSGYRQFVPDLVAVFKPDYIVGSVHFVDDINFDYSPEMYERAAAHAGGVDRLYHRYFDLQYEMIEFLRPAVVGHFDLVRIFDADYRRRLEQPDILARIERNLQAVKKHDLILDFNLRALAKGASEPYLAEPILHLARSYDIAVVPGDDSHGSGDVGNFFDRGVAILQHHGFSTQWRRPV
ncbi:histidinol-phosphatase [Desulfofustis limnaeus]|jgi:histidinol-phosphatase (PHP family)|uniref:Histidinol-phosphatase n=1 Tax=Desulfofustis limnaeus TaxID=2740163 RepID=A0ABM7W6N7_9BACT|nr:histidinol-phosphatase [Desulfofustis limnaeus]BDD86611.1 putative histidinol-phosphatase [Desulfofustis limnaeus]